MDSPTFINKDICFITHKQREFCHFQYLSSVLCKLCELFFFVVSSPSFFWMRTTSFSRKEQKNSNGSEWVGWTAICVRVLWLTCRFYSAERFVMQKQSKTASCMVLLTFQVEFLSANMPTTFRQTRLTVCSIAVLFHRNLKQWDNRKGKPV